MILGNGPLLSKSWLAGLKLTSLTGMLSESWLASREVTSLTDLFSKLKILVDLLLVDHIESVFLHLVFLPPSLLKHTFSQLAPLSSLFTQLAQLLWIRANTQALRHAHTCRHKHTQADMQMCTHKCTWDMHTNVYSYIIGMQTQKHTVAYMHINVTVTSLAHAGQEKHIGYYHTVDNTEI